MNSQGRSWYGVKIETSGSVNCEANYEYRNSNDDTEWELDNDVFININIILAVLI